VVAFDNGEEIHFFQQGVSNVEKGSRSSKLKEKLVHSLRSSLIRSKRITTAPKVGRELEERIKTERTEENKLKPRIFCPAFANQFRKLFKCIWVHGWTSTTWKNKLKKTERETKIFTPLIAFSISESKANSQKGSFLVMSSLQMMPNE
jgi:hypothetical protein